MRRLPIAGVVLLVVMFGLVLSRGPVAYAQAGGPAAETFFETVARALILSGALRSATGDIQELFGLGSKPNPRELERALENLARKLQERFKHEQELYDVLHNRPWKLVQFLAELTHQQELGLDNVALESYLAVSSVSDTDIQDVSSNAAIRQSGESGDVIFNEAASALRSDQHVDWADEFIAQRMLQAYLDGRDGLTREQLTVPALRAADETRMEAIKATIEGLVDELGVDMVALLQEALRRVRSSWLPSLARQVDELTIALAQTNKQLDTIQGELRELKQRRDPLPLILAIVALVLALGALGLTILRRRTA